MIVGDIILVHPKMQMLEVLIVGTLLDMAVAVKLDMEGGRTNRHVHFKPSRVTVS